VHLKIFKNIKFKFKFDLNILRIGLHFESFICFKNTYRKLYNLQMIPISFIYLLIKYTFTRLSIKIKLFVLTKQAYII